MNRIACFFLLSMFFPHIDVLAESSSIKTESPLQNLPASVNRKEDERKRNLLYARLLIARSEEIRPHNILYSRELVHKATKIVASESGKESREYALCLAALGNCDIELHKFEAAAHELETARKLMQPHKTTYKPQNVLAVDCNLALAYRRSGKIDAAERLYRDTITQLEAARATNTPQYLAVLISMANLYLDQDDQASAHVYLENSVRVLDRLPAELPTETYLAMIKCGWARFYNLEKNFSKSNSLFTEALNTFDKMGNPPLIKYAEVVCYYSDSLVEQHDYQQANEILTRKYASIQKFLGPNHPKVDEIDDKLARLK